MSMMTEIKEIKKLLKQFKNYGKEIKKLMDEQDKYRRELDKKTPLLKKELSRLLIEENNLEVVKIYFSDDCLYLEFPVRKIVNIDEEGSHKDIDKVVSLLGLSENDYENCVGLLGHDSLAFEYLCIPLL